MQWLNVAFLRMDRLLGQSCVLVEFFDTARINSHRTLPYLQGWNARYRELGLRVIGVHTPGYSFGRDAEVVERAATALRIEHPVLLDPNYEVWRLYGNQGWPARYLFDRRGDAAPHALRRGQLRGDRDRDPGGPARDRPDVALPDPLEPMRPEDEEGVLLEPQTADVALPGEIARAWNSCGTGWTERTTSRQPTPAPRQPCSSPPGGAWAVLSGPVEPGLYESDGTVVADDPGLRLHGFQFAALPPG